MRTTFHWSWRCVVLVSLSFLSPVLCTPALAAELLPPGFRPLPLGVHALVGGKVVVKPGQVLDAGTIVIRDGLIQTVGRETTPPPDARVWDMKGKTIYAGFIEPYWVQGATNPPVTTSDTEPVDARSYTAAGVKFFGVAGVKEDLGGRGPGYEVEGITPQNRAVRDYAPTEKMLTPLRELGFTAAVVVPGKGIIRGTSALVALGEEDPNASVLKPDVFEHIALEARPRSERAYPSSLMGVIAAVRQAFFDARHYAVENADYRQHPQGRTPPEFNPALEALAPAIGKKMRVAFEPGSALMVDRAARVAAELDIDFCIVSCGQEWRRPDLAKAGGATFIVPVDFPTLPKLPNESDWDQVPLDALRAWDWAPENPALLRRQQLRVAFTTHGLDDKKRFRPNLRLALDRGLAPDDALAALTTEPARLCGVENLLGTIEPGKLANLTVVDGGDYFDPDTKVRAVWIAGRVYQLPSEEPPPEDAAGKSADKQISGGETQPPRSKEEPEKQPKPPEVAAAKGESTTTKPAPPDTEKSEEKGKRQQIRALEKTRDARSPLDGRGPLAEPAAVLIKDATVWTCGPQGKLEDADLLVVGGKIRAVGRGLSVPAGVPSPLLIDGRGMHLTPGLIDCHSHTAILGSVNEATLPSSAMVRIQDVVNSETANLYEQLAGGVTTVNLLHGSANPIGGQNCVIKLRDGASPEALVFAAAPPGIKFALGENVKQSNWGEKFTTRFPQTRMGVRTFIANRFTAAREYLAKMDAASRNSTLPPRRNLELEAIGQILQGKRWIHCHSYRQDEILMLIRLMESFGVKIGTFQHVLEGYKVADEIARHGAGASSFSDWWAYKFEVYDAIPYNGSLMHERGVLVSFNSDSSELARRLYAEAAKAVKYGGTPEIEALKFVTFNPAKQLRIDSRVGSLEPGKDADFALWSKSPLDSGTVCLQTWIDGKKYFERARNGERVAALAREREALLAKAKKVARLSDKAEDSGQDSGAKFFSLEHQFDGKARGCLDEQEGGR